MRVLSVDVGIKNLAYCVYDSESQSVDFWKVFEIHPIANDMARGICQILTELEASEPQLEMTAIQKVVIELQPGRNQRVKAIQHFLHMFYVLKHAKNVVLFSPRHKLAGTGCENSGRTPAMYRQRKKASVALCECWLRAHPQNERWTTMLSRQGFKKDDAADALNQALAFCHPRATSATTVHGADAASVVASVEVIRARKPSARQASARGCYSKANLKHILCKDWRTTEAPELPSRIRSDARVMRAVTRLYRGNVAACIHQLCPNKHASASAASGSTPQQ
jgi:hypothetical protein